MTKTRIEWIDLVRAIAILTVLFVHSSDGIYIIQSDALMNFGTYSRIFQYISLFIGRIGVPFFLMISGYLLLDRHYDDEKTQKFWKNNCKNLIIITVIWTIIYVICLQFVEFNSASINPVEGGNLLFSHMWYMPMIIGMYLSIPFVAAALKQFNVKVIYSAMIVFAVLAFLVPFISLLFDMQGIHGVTVQFCLGFSGGVYGIYIILGYLVKKDFFKKYSSGSMWCLAIVSFLICVLFQYYTYIRGYNYALWYEFPFVLTGSFALFELCSRMESVRYYSAIQFLSKYSFAVFLVHNIFRIPLLPIASNLPFTEPVKAVILWIFLTIISYAATVIIYRIPRFGKYILYMR